MTELRFHELTAEEKAQVTALDFGEIRIRPSLTQLRFRFARGKLVGYRWADPEQRRESLA